MTQTNAARPPEPTPHVGRNIAAALLAERRRIAMAFRATGATTEPTAASLKALGLRHDAPFHELMTLGVIHQAGNGFWFDEARYERAVERPRFRVLGMIAIAAIFVVFVVTLVGVLTA